MPISSVLVLFEPVKSAEPPTVSVITGLTTFKVLSDALRVATLGRFTAASFFIERMAAPSFFVVSPAKALLNWVWREGDNFSNWFSQIALSTAPLMPIVSHSAFTSAGISKAPYCQPYAAFASANCAASVNAPCPFEVS